MSDQDSSRGVLSVPIQKTPRPSLERIDSNQFSGLAADNLSSTLPSLFQGQARAVSSVLTPYEGESESSSASKEQPKALSDPGIRNIDARPTLSALNADTQTDCTFTDVAYQIDEEQLATTHDGQHLVNSVLNLCTTHSRQNSAAASAFNSHQKANRSFQKVHLVDEDLEVTISGFFTSTVGYVAYITLCLLSFGVAFLLFRWLPRWYVCVVGRGCHLRDCDWVVMENQWSELVIVPVKTELYGRPVSTVFGVSDKLFNGLDEDCDPAIEHLRTLDYRYLRFHFHPLENEFVLSTGWKDPEWTDIRLVQSGLNSHETIMRKKVFGKNLIDVQVKATGQLLIDEVLHPFYIFQVASLILWTVDSYYYYAVCIFLMSLISISTTMLETRATMNRLREVSLFECDVRVLRNGFWKFVTSSDLVPGDVYELSDPNLTQLPSDSLLLSGDCIVNESMLTGESVPVSKFPATNESLRNLDPGASFTPLEIVRHFLFCGTKIIRSRRPLDNGDVASLALVIRTGFNTTKGALIRSMLFPKPSKFKIYRDSLKYVGAMAMVASFGFVASLINFIRLGLQWHLIIVRALDLITVVVPPALPATLAIGTNFAISRLKKKQIFCTSPQRVNIGGKLDIMCFDKTGTLTEDGLDVLGIRVTTDTNMLSDLISKAPSLDNSGSTRPNALHDSLRATLHTMATCHSLRAVEGNLIGDPLDVKMFQFTEWSFQEGQHNLVDGDVGDQGGLAPSVACPPDGSRQLGVLKSFEFASRLRRSSVVVRQFGQKSGDIFVKGAPEALREICREESFPSDCDEILSCYTQQGYRVIGCATRHIPKLSWVKAQKMARFDVESNLDFVGFIIFENRLKSTTTTVLKELLDSGIGAVMVTGDNILTAVSVARECGLLDRNMHCFIPRFIRGDARDPSAELEWTSIDNSRHRLDESSLLPLPISPEADISLPYDMINRVNHSLAITGEVFRWIVDFASPKILQRLLVLGKVFARMSPDEKHELVEKLQGIGYSCGFCGDGANDCAALKAADVGISLSKAEASVAAPFTSRVFDIGCVLEVIREGRAALVTSFSCFRYMSLYSAIQFTSVSFLYAKGSNLGDFQFLFIDLLLILPLAILMGKAGPAPGLHKKKPMANLVSRKVLTPLLGLMFICVLVQGMAYLTIREQPWYLPPKITKPDQPNISNSENTAIFLISCLEYIFAAVLLNAGLPFRQRVTENILFLAAIILALIVTVIMVLFPTPWIERNLELTFMTLEYKLFLLELGVTYFAASWTYNEYGAYYLIKGLRNFYEKLRKETKPRKFYKQVREEILRNVS